MKCKDLEILFYLNRPDELSSQQLKTIENHISVCPNCARLKKRIDKTGSLYASIRKTKPEIADPEAITRSIMNRIQANLSKQTTTYNFIDAFASWFYKPLVKFSLLFILFIMIGSFLEQQVKMTDSISRLENQINNYVPSIKINRKGILKRLRKIPSSANTKSIKNQINFFELKRSIKHIGIINRLAIYAELYEIPEFKDMFPTADFKEENILILLSKKNDLLLQLDEIINKRRN